MPVEAGIPNGISSSSMDTDNLLVNSATLPDQILAQPPPTLPVTMATGMEEGSASIRPEDLVVPKDEPMDTGTNPLPTAPFPSAPVVSNFSSESGRYYMGEFTESFQDYS